MLGRRPLAPRQLFVNDATCAGITFIFNRFLFIIIIVVLLVLLGGGGGAAAAFCIFIYRAVAVDMATVESISCPEVWRCFPNTVYFVPSHSLSASSSGSWIQPKYSLWG